MDRFALTRAEEGCAIFAGSGSGVGHRGLFWMSVFRLRIAYHGVGDCGVCVGGGRLQLNWIDPGAPVWADRGHCGRFFHGDCATICAWDSLDESSGGCHHVAWSWSGGRHREHLVADVLGCDRREKSQSADDVHVARRQSQPFYYWFPGRAVDWCSKVETPVPNLELQQLHVISPGLLGWTTFKCSGRTRILVRSS